MYDDYFWGKVAAHAYWDELRKLGQVQQATPKGKAQKVIEAGKGLGEALGVGPGLPALAAPPGMRPSLSEKLLAQAKHSVGGLRKHPAAMPIASGLGTLGGLPGLLLR
jgi:hypothetical protein